jgi:hypothetical protein
MKNDIKEFLENKYSYTVENYRRGESLWLNYFTIIYL